MSTHLQTIKQTFRQGRHAEAIADCEALCAADPGNREARQLCGMMNALARNFARAAELLQGVVADDPANGDALFNLAMCERELKDFQRAAQHFRAYTARFPTHPDGWASLADCEFHRGDHGAAIAAAECAVQLDAGSLPAWTVRARSQQAAGQFEAALASFRQAIHLAPKLAELRAQRGDLHEIMGRMDLAADDYREAVALAPGDDATLKKATTCLLQLDRGDEAIALCRDVLKVRPDSLTAKLGAEWLLSQQVPLWHVPMMNEEERNRPYFQGLEAAVTPEKTVFEIGTGSGLLAMMAARLGAKQVHTCEAVRLVAQTAERIVERNGFGSRVRVLGKPSYAVEVGKDLPAPADILVHEIFSSELLGEHVLPAIEDAKARLLKPGGTILPGVASIMVALVSGEALGRELHVSEAFGFDLGAFNAIHAKKRPIHREDLPRVLLSDDVEAFRFDFAAHDSFPPETKELQVTVKAPGTCWGVIQWIRFEFGHGIFFENHPSRSRSVASWQHTIYRFDEPLALQAGRVVRVRAMHDRSRPWFELAE